MNCSVSESPVSAVLQLTAETHIFASILASQYCELYRDAPKECMFSGAGLLYVSAYLVKYLDTIKPDWFGFLFHLRIYMFLFMITSRMIGKIQTDLRN